MDPFSFAIGQVVSFGASYAFPTKGPRLQDLKISASTYGASIPWVFGDVRVPGNMIWSQDIREHHRKKAAPTGKGGFYIDYTYTCTYAMALCRGPITRVAKIWADGKLIYDVTGDSEVTQNNKYDMRFYTGGEDQLPDSAMVAALGEDQTPAYRGLAYILFQDMPLADFSNRIPQITAEVHVDGAHSPVRITPQVATTDLYQGSAYLTADSQRGYFYTQAGQTIQRFRISDGGLDGSGPVSGLPVTQYAADFIGHQPGELTSIYGCTRGGYLIAGCNFSNTEPLVAIEPYGFSVVGVFGVDGPGLVDDPAHGFVATLVGACCVDGAGQDYFCAVSLFGDVGVLRVPDMAFAGGGFGLRVYGGSNANFAVAGRDGAPGEGWGFYFCSGGDATGGQTTGVTVSGLGAATASWSTPGPATSGPIVYDSYAPGPLFFWSKSGQHYLTKVSEDTGREAWTVEVPNYPTYNFDGSSNVSTGTFSFVCYPDKVYTVNTLTGEFLHDYGPNEVRPNDPRYPALVGTPNWDAYLRIYPDVLAQYKVNGDAVADSPEGYASWHYYHYGKSEGRTLPLYGDSALADDYKPIPAPYADQYGFGTFTFDSNRGVLIGITGTSGIIIHTGGTTDATSVGDIFYSILTDPTVGLTDAQVDMTRLYDTPVEGYAFARSADVKTILGDLTKVYCCDIVESNGRLTGVLRGDGSGGDGAALTTIPQAMLGSSSDDASDFWEETRVQESDLPRAVSLSYMNLEDDFETTTAHSQRIVNPVPTMFSSQQVALQMDITLHPAEAKSLINTVLYTQWAERVHHQTRLPWAYLWLDPGDMVNVTLDDGAPTLERIHATEIGADYALATTTYSADTDAYDSPPVTADGGGSGRPGRVDLDQAAIPFILNTPLLRDMDDSGGSFSRYYVGAGVDGPAPFDGALIFRSTNAIDYADVDALSQDAEWGVVRGVLASPRHGWFALDWSSVLTVQPAGRPLTLESATDDELNAGANFCLVGAELIQFRDAVQNADQSWTLTNLYRARRGTDYACDHHQVGETFLLLDAGSLDGGADTIDARGQHRYFKGVGQGASISKAPVHDLVYEPRDLDPRAPNDIRRAVAGDGSIGVTFARRTRLGGELVDGTGEVNLSEGDERYEAYILPYDFLGDTDPVTAALLPALGDPSRGLAPTSFKRMYVMTSPAFSYPLADQQADAFDVVLDTLHVVVYQISSAVGRGFPGSRSIPPWAAF